MRSRFRPRFEALEARDVPAVFYWMGSGGPTDSTADARVETNWNPHDFSPPRPNVPGPEDDVIFTDDVFPPWITPGNCYHFGTAGSYRSVSFVGNYAGTVTLDSGFATGQLNLSSPGAISQPASGTDITVVGDSASDPGPYADDFIWTKGTLNSTANLANLIVTGSTTTALIAPANAGTVTTKSTLKFLNGATGTINPGTVNFAGGDGMDVGEYCSVTVAPGQPPATVVLAYTADFDPQGNPRTRTLQLHSGSAFTVVSGPFTSQFPLQNDGGVFEVRGGASASFSGTLTYTLTGFPVPFFAGSFLQAGGTTRLHGGSTLTAANGAAMWGGELVVDARAGVGTATVQGNLSVGGGKVWFSLNAVNSQIVAYGTLEVTGNVSWSGGTYEPWIDWDRQGDNCFWHCTGTMTISGSASIVPKPLAWNTTSVAGRTWTVIGSNQGITGTPGVSAGYALDPVGANPVSGWTVRKT
jgi:hypothetical protein